MSTWIPTVLAPVAIMVALIAVVARRAAQMRLLAQDGVEVTGRVVAKLEQRRRKRRHGSPVRRIHYAYQDAAGQTHEYRSRVTDAFWQAQTEGGPIAIVYSQRQPQISAPQHLVAQAREALGGRRPGALSR